MYIFQSPTETGSQHVRALVLMETTGTLLQRAQKCVIFEFGPSPLHLKPQQNEQKKYHPNPPKGKRLSETYIV